MAKITIAELRANAQEWLAKNKLKQKHQQLGVKMTAECEDTPFVEEAVMDVIYVHCACGGVITKITGEELCAAKWGAPADTPTGFWEVASQEMQAQAEATARSVAMEAARIKESRPSAVASAKPYRPGPVIYCFNEEDLP